MAQFAMAAFAIGTALMSARQAGKADDARVHQAEEQNAEVERAVGEALRINAGNLERSRVRTKEMQSRELLSSLGSLRSQTATRVGRSSQALMASALAAGHLASRDTDTQAREQTNVLVTQAESQIAGLPVALSTPGIRFTAGLQGLQTGLSIATSVNSMSE